MQACEVCLPSATPILHAEAPVVANPEEAERALRQVQQMQAGALTDSWAEVPTIVGDIPSVSRTGADAPDISPPRRRRHDSPDVSPPRRKRHGSPDISPPRKRHHSSPDLSPPRQQASNTASVPPRNRRPDSSDINPPRKQRHDSPDISPPRKRQLEIADASPPRRRRHDSPDVSPPRRQQPGIKAKGTKQSRTEGADPSPKRSRHDSPDVSPPRQARPPSSHADATRRGQSAEPGVLALLLLDINCSMCTTGFAMFTFCSRTHRPACHTVCEIGPCCLKRVSCSWGTILTSCTCWQGLEVISLRQESAEEFRLSPRLTHPADPASWLTGVELGRSQAKSLQQKWQPRQQRKLQTLLLWAYKSLAVVHKRCVSFVNSTAGMH